MALFDEGNPRVTANWEADIVLLTCSLHALLPFIQSIFEIFVRCMGHWCNWHGGTQVRQWWSTDDHVLFSIVQDGILLTAPVF